MLRFAERLFGILTKLDAFSDAILKPVTKVFCYLTGRNNFVLARGTLVLGCLSLWLDAMIDFQADMNVWNGMVLFLIMPWWTLIMKARRDLYSRIERAFEEMESDTLDLDPRDMWNYSFDRLILNPFMLLSLPFVWTGIDNVGFTLYIASFYFALHGNPGGKSVVKRAVEATKKAAAKVAEKARDLVPSPAPVPVPIGAR